MKFTITECFTIYDCKYSTAYLGLTVISVIIARLGDPDKCDIYHQSALLFRATGHCRAVKVRNITLVTHEN